MKLVPGVLNWSYHRLFWNKWSDNLDTYIGKVSTLKRKFGYDEMCISIGLEGGTDAFHSHDVKYIGEVKRKLENEGLTPIPLIGVVEVHADPDIVNISVESIKRLMQEAILLGASTVQFYPNLHGRLSREKAVRVYRDALKAISERACDLGLNCCSEEYCTFSGDELSLIMRGIPNVGIVNDIGNWLILGEDPVAASRKFADITVHVHLKDYIFEDGIWQSVPFGQGMVDIGRILNILRSQVSKKTMYLAFETDLDAGDEDLAMEKCFRFYQDWCDAKS